MKLKVKPEGRENIYIPDKESLKEFITFKKLKKIHNFITASFGVIGADHDVKSVLEDIDKAERLAVFTDQTMNFGHSLALIIDNKLNAFDIGKISKEELELLN